jgi:MFS family permease
MFHPGVWPMMQQVHFRPPWMVCRASLTLVPNMESSHDFTGPGTARLAGRSARIPRPRIAELRSNLRCGWIDGTCFSLMVGSGETYLAAFVLALNMGEVTAGLITSLPMLAGAVMQLVSPAMVRRLGSHRLWVVINAAIQAASFIPLVTAAIIGSIPEWALFAVAAIYWGSGMATGPAWNTWIGTLVPQRIRAHYFGRRSRAAHIAVLVGIVGGGIVLHEFAEAHRTLIAFAIVFATAGIARFVSAHFLARHTEPIKPDQRHRMVPARELLARFRHKPDGRLLLYMLAVQTAVQVSGPYFTPFMLGNMKMTYFNYLLLIATAYCARILLVPRWGAVARRVGTMRVLWVAGTALIPLSSLWLISQNITFLFCVQLASGTIWGAYELATLLLLFETIAEEERTSVLTTFNLANAAATVIGSTIGGSLLHALGTDRTAYLTIFGLSGCLRLMTISLLIPAVRSFKPRDLPQRPIPVPTRVVSVRPEFADSERPILPGLPEPRMHETG